MTDFRKKFAALAVALCCVFVLCGCDTSVTYYYSATESEYIYVYSIEIPTNERRVIEESSPNGWTIGAYLTKLCEATNGVLDWRDSDSSVVCSIEYVVPVPEEKEDDEPTVEPTLDRGFLFNTYVYEQDNPFNGVLDGLRGDGTPSGSILALIRNGSAANGLPALTTAFPAVDLYAAGGVKTTFVWYNDKVSPVNGEKVRTYGGTVAVWEGTLGEDGKIEYTYSVPNAVGWYALVAIIGGAVVALVILLTRKSKEKPRMVKMERGRRKYQRVYPSGGGNRGGGNRGGAQGGSGGGKIDPFGYDEPTGEGDEERARRELDDLFFGDDD